MCLRPNPTSELLTLQNRGKGNRVSTLCLVSSCNKNYTYLIFPIQCNKHSYIHSMHYSPNMHKLNIQVSSIISMYQLYIYQDWWAHQYHDFHILVIFPYLSRWISQNFEGFSGVHLSVQIRVRQFIFMCAHFHFREHTPANTEGLLV